MQSTIRSNSLGENQIINNQIYAHYYIPNYRTNLISERLNPQTYKIRRFCLNGASKGGFVFGHLRGTDVNPKSSQFRFGEPRHSPPDCHSLPLRPFAPLTTSELFALRAHNPKPSGLTHTLESKKER